jgi:hypothetical protein
MPSVGNCEQTAEWSIISTLPLGSFRVRRAEFHIDESREARVRFTFSIWAIALLSLARLALRISVEGA